MVVARTGVRDRSMDVTVGLGLVPAAAGVEIVVLRRQLMDVAPSDGQAKLHAVQSAGVDNPGEAAIPLPRRRE